MEVVAASVHTGKTAVSASVRKVDKDDKHIDLIKDNPKVSKHSSRILEKPQPFKPGSDSIVLECEFDHRDDDKPLRGGMGTEDEIRQRIQQLGSAAILGFDGGQHVAQLQFRAFAAGSRSPDCPLQRSIGTGISRGG